MNNDLQKKYRHLIQIIKELESVVVAYSGGLDSTLVAFLSRQVLGSKALAVTATSETYTPAELAEATELAGRFGLSHQVISTNELDCADFSSNPTNRCYYCKQELFKKLREIADKNNIRNVVDGTTLSDANDYRPGRQAALELNVRSPLKEAGIGKEEVRIISRALEIPNWDKPAGACLASRFPYGEEITEDKLNRVASAEIILKNLGFRIIRVRHHQDIARIEVGSDEISRFSDPALRQEVVQQFQKLGYLYVTIDLGGYRSGNMNRKIGKETDYGHTDLDLGIDKELKKFLSVECPRCEEHKLEEETAGESRFKQCPHCGGAWFNINELERSLGRGVKFSLPTNLPAETLPNSSKPVCPLCHTGLIQIKAMDASDLTVHACLICQGRWVDGPEIARQQQKGLFAHIRELVMRLF